MPSATPRPVQTVTRHIIIIIVLITDITSHSQEERGKVRTEAAGIPAYARDISVALSWGEVHTENRLYRDGKAKPLARP